MKARACRFDSLTRFRERTRPRIGIRRTIAPPPTRGGARPRRADPVTGVYIGVSWGMLVASLGLMTIGLWNSKLLLSEKGFSGIGFAMSLFAVVAVQKNVRDLAAHREAHPELHARPERTEQPRVTLH